MYFYLCFITKFEGVAFIESTTRWHYLATKKMSVSSVEKQFTQNQFIMIPCVKNNIRHAY